MDWWRDTPRFFQISSLMFVNVHNSVSQLSSCLVISENFEGPPLWAGGGEGSGGVGGSYVLYSPYFIFTFYFFFFFSCIQAPAFDQLKS